MITLINTYDNYDTLGGLSGVAHSYRPGAGYGLGAIQNYILLLFLFDLYSVIVS
jgi:hypothetical protein